MSGGVDSSLAAKLFKDEGYDCLGVFMRLGLAGDCGHEAAARRVCQKLGIKFYPLDLQRAFNNKVKKYFLKSYKIGLTPNPCVKCNQFIKFGELLKKIRALGCDYLSTGHYAKLIRFFPRRGKEKNKGVYKIFRARDLSKDQTYFLYNLTQNQLRHIFFPLGDLTKAKTKAEAKKAGLPHLKTESQDVCFLSGDHNIFLKKRLKIKKGKIKTLDNKVVGEHRGLPFYTTGQRKGVEIGGRGPYYVVSRNFKTNTLYVTNNPVDPALSGKYLLVKNVNWLSGNSPKLPFKCSAVIRYRHPAVPVAIAEISSFAENETISRHERKMAGLIFSPQRDYNGKLLVKFSFPQRAITPGQSVVFYKGDELIGGGIID